MSQHYDASTDGTDSYQLLRQENGQLKETFIRQTEMIITRSDLCATERIQNFQGDSMKN